jgi:hypothetical protein
MSQGLGRRLGRAVLGWCACTWCCAAVAVAAGDAVDGQRGLLDASRDILRARRPLELRALGTATNQMFEWRDAVPPRAHLDLSPVVDGIFDFFNRHGVPLREQRDENGDGPVGVYADFGVGRDVPAVSFHLGDRPIEPIGAFYSNERGFRCAVVWPIERFTLRLEGGEDSELGYYGIAGVQWLDPHRPLAIGIGLPMNLRDTERGVGVVLQLRMTLD